MSHISTVSGRRFFFDESGTGPPLLLIPGHGGYRRGCLIWLAKALAPRFRVVAMDNRDAGESEPEAEYYGLGDMAGDAVALLDALGIDRAHILAHSMGSAIALQLALDHPTRVDLVVLLSPAVGGEPGHRAGEPLPPPAAWWVDDPVERARRVLPAVVGPDYRARMGESEAAAIAELERGNRTTWAGMMRREAAAAGDEHILSRLAKIRGPTLVIHGDADVPVPLEQGQALAAGIPGARFVVLPGVGHRPWVERPEPTVDAILAFLSEAGSAEAFSGSGSLRRRPRRTRGGCHGRTPRVSPPGHASSGRC
jgi:3-oxoadipate enol-lactonase